MSEKERDDAAALLAKFSSEGRLTLEEFSERVEIVLAARTQGDIDRVMADLPEGDVAYKSPLPATGWQVAALSGSSKKGRWRPKARMKAICFMGGIELDLRSAEIDQPEITITAIAFMGGIDITVPEGVAVHLGGFAFMGGKDARIANTPILPGTPVINVRAFPIMGGIQVRSKKARPRLSEDLRSAVGSHVRDRIERSLGPGRRPGAVHHAVHHHKDPPLDARAALALAADLLDQLFPRPPEARAPSGAPAAVVPPHGTVTIQFCDISGFTEMTERLGDLECQRMLTTYFEIVRGEVVRHGGYEVKCHADEAMLAFNGAGQAVRCAIDIQRALARYNEAHPEVPIVAHIGLHTGEAIQDGGDFLGRTVILASRITDEAAAGEILVSSVLRELISSTPDLCLGDPRTVSLQGVSAAQELSPVLWS